jgi:hypothetical protein
VTILAVRALLAPCFVILASLAGRRFGVRVSGLVAGLPVVAGPILLVLALQHGTAFASGAATGALLGMVGVAGFALVYAGVCPRLRWPGAVAAAYAAFVLAVVAMRPVSVGAAVAFLIAVAALTATLRLMPRPRSAAREPAPYPRWDLPFRAGCTMLLVLAVTGLASRLGPHLSGLITTFPVITAVLSAFTHAQRGHDEAVRLLRGFTVGFFSFAVFCLLVATTVGPLGIAPSFVLATTAAVAVQAGVMAASRRLHRLRELAAAQADLAVDPLP